jgi:hypothetical protein
VKKSQLWKIYVAKNPSFAGDGNITMSARGLRKLFDQTWDFAFHEGEDEIEHAPNVSESKSVDDLRKIFGMF